jgi:uncharacterized protein involved in exopolysaccharide biosynthesis
MEAGADTGEKRLGDYFLLLRRQWLVFLLCLLVAMGLAVAYLKVATKTYESTAAVLVTAPTSGSSQSAISQSNAAATTINLDTEAQMVTATPTLDGVAKTLHLSAADEANLVNDVSVTVPPSTEILDITYSAGSPKGAQDGAKAFADAYLAQRAASAQATLDAQAKALEAQIAPLNTQLASLVKAAATLSPTSADASRNLAQQNAVNNQINTLNGQLSQLKTVTPTPGQIVIQPELPTSPSSPNKLITLAAGLVLGLLAGLGIAALRQRADDVIRTPDDLYRRTRVPVATVLSTRLHAGQVGLVPPLSADGRGYARLRNLVTTSLEDSPRRVVLVAGVRRGGGPIAANLAASLARAGEEVFLVCGDVFGNTASELLDEEPGDGLAEVLAGERGVDDVMRRLPGVPGLRVLGPGRDPDRADALLQTRSPRRLIDRLLGSGAYVVIEAPPTRDSPDAQTLANVSELAVLVVEAADTSAREVLDACAQLESVHTAVLGAVIARYGKDSNREKRYVEPPAERDVEGASADSDTAAGDAGPRTVEVSAVGSTAIGARPAVGNPGEQHGDHRPHDEVAPTVTRPALVPPGTRGPAPR